MIAICPVGPPKLMNPSLIQKRAASRNDTPCVGSVPVPGSGVVAPSGPAMRTELRERLGLAGFGERTKARGALWVACEVGVVSLQQGDGRAGLLGRFPISADVRVLLGQLLVEPTVGCASAVGPGDGRFEQWDRLARPPERAKRLA